MIRTRKSERRLPRSARHGAALGLALVALLCVVIPASAQQTPQAAPATQPEQAAPSEPAPSAAAQASRQGGLFGTIGRWIDRSLARVSTAWKGKSEASPEDARKSAGVGLLPNAKIVSGRERCETAANGAPDCRGAIEALQQRTCGGQQPRRPIGGKMSGSSVDFRGAADDRRVPDGILCSARVVPVTASKKISKQKSGKV